MVRHYGLYNGNNSFAYGVGRGITLGTSFFAGKLIGIISPFVLLVALACWPISVPVGIYLYCRNKRKKEEEIISNIKENSNRNKAIFHDSI